MAAEAHSIRSIITQMPARFDFNFSYFKHCFNAFNVMMVAHNNNHKFITVCMNTSVSTTISF